MSIIVHLFENMSDQGQKHVNIDTRMTHDRGACAIDDSEQVSESLENLQVCAQGDFNTSMYSSLSRSRNRSFELIARFHKSPKTSRLENWEDPVLCHTLWWRNITHSFVVKGSRASSKLIIF